MEHFEEFENYRRDKWWWWVSYLELGATICANPKMSAKFLDFSEMLKEFNEVSERRRLMNDADDTE